MNIKELEKVLLDQIEKLNDDSIADDPEECKLMLSKSQSISQLAGNYMQIQQFKLEAVKEFGKNGDIYAGYLGIEEAKK